MTETIEEEQQTELVEIGQLLREAREQKNISLRQVADITRINLHTLQNIEDGTLVQNPGPVFMRGFIRTYSDLMGLDSQFLLEKLNAVVELQDPETLSRTATPSTKSERFILQEKKYLLFLLAVLIVGGGYFLINYFVADSPQLSQDSQTSNAVQIAPQSQSTMENAPPSISEEPPPAPESLPTAPPETQPEIVEAIEENTEALPAQPVAPAAQPETVEAVEENTEALPTTPTNSLAADTLEQPSSGENSASVVAPELLTLSIKATLSTWIDVQIDDDEPLEISLIPGEEYILEAKERYVLTVGNVKGVEFFLNGILRPIDSENELLENWVLDKSILVSE